MIVTGDLARFPATLSALARQRLDRLRMEVLVVRAWPQSADARSLPALPSFSADLRVLDVAAESPSAALNAGLEKARGRFLLPLEAGALPEGDDLLARHLEAHDGEVAAVIGTIRPARGLRDPIATGWVGIWPDGAPAPPVRHLSLDRAAVAAADGLDERLADLEVALLDLLARLAAAGHRHAVRPDLVVRDPAPARAPGLARCATAGRSARALAELLVQRGAPTRELGSRRSRMALRWLEPVLRAGASLPGASDGRLPNLAHRAAFARGLGRFPPPLEATARGGIAFSADRTGRSSVTVVVPFAGTGEEGEALLDALTALTRRPGDQVFVVDNTRTPVLRGRDGIRVLRADGEWSSYHARNTGARAATTPWILFLDSDCRPVPWLLDAYFTPSPSEGAGAVAGGVLAAPGHSGWAARWSAGTEVLSQARSLGRESRPYAVTANLLVRRAAFERLGGFAEGVRSGGDTEFSWRLQEDDWSIDYRSRAAVIHLHRTSVRDLVRQYRRYGAGAAWLDRRYPGALSGWPTFSLPMLTEPLRDLAAGRFELALGRATDLVITAGAWIGALSSNRPDRPSAPRPAATVAFAATYPDSDAPGICARVGEMAPDVAVESRCRPLRFACPRPDIAVVYAEDDAPLDGLRALRWLARQPGGRGALAAAFVEGRAALRALAADAAVARRVAEGGHGDLVAVDSSPAAVTALDRVRTLLGRLAGGPASARPSDYPRRSST